MKILSLLAAFVCLGTAPGLAADEGDLVGARDYHSYANPEEVRVTHLDLDLRVDFDKRQLRGSVVHTLKRQPGSHSLSLDSRGLLISSVEQGQNGKWSKAEFRSGRVHAALGTELIIALDATANQVRIRYATGPGAAGLDWLAPEQTAGKREPFLYTQAQPIHARSFIPLQDSPAVRVTYNATIHTPVHMRAVMSAANNPNAPKSGVFTFSMLQPIPSYLIALAVGDLEFQAMGARTGIYAEKVTLAAAAREFEDTESMLEAVERRYGDYAWGRYDLLILPPSFPWGGMENPRLSFITPTVIAGDKSLVALIAHELAHSWSGNTVTNATWRDLWLNEGFTTYLTYRIMEDVYGVARSNMERVLGYQELLQDVADKPAADQRLNPDLRDRDPDDGFSNIPYEKGALLVTEMELAVGRQVFDAFLRKYFARFAFESITTRDFLAYFESTLVREHPQQLSMARLAQWIEQPGIPAGAPVPESDVFAVIDKVHAAWLSGEVAAREIQSDGWTVHEWRYFLNKLPPNLSRSQLRDLDEAFALTASSNSAILHSWLLIAIRNDYQRAWPALEQYLTGIGRRSLIVPLYKALLETPAGRDRAMAIYAKASPGYHVVARNTIGKLLGQ